MALPVEKLGTKTEPRTAVIDPDRAKAYAAATNDDNPAYTSGKYAPPVFAVVPVWDTVMAAAMDLVPPEMAMFIVHGEQDMVFHQPLVPGVELTNVGEPLSIRVSGSGTRLVVRIESRDPQGSLVVEQYFTIFIRGMSDGESGGPDKPDHTFPEEARVAKVAEHAVHVDDDQTYRYSEASGDPMPIHLDAEFAKSVGLPGIIAHGLCTMAMTSQSIIRTVADGDPARLKRLAVRFAANVIPGNDVVTHVYAAGERSGRKVYAFESVSNGDVVIKNGLAEIEA